jgi:hypothetical protein
LKEGRACAGQRTKDYPCPKLKDLAAARLLALHKFDLAEANKWAEQNQPRDRNGKRFAWFGNKARNSSGPLFQVAREGRRSLARFERNFHNFSALAMKVIADLEISDFAKEMIAKAENSAVFGVQKGSPRVH